MRQRLPENIENNFQREGRLRKESRESKIKTAFELPIKPFIESEPFYNSVIEKIIEDEEAEADLDEKKPLKFPLKKYGENIKNKKRLRRR